MVSLIATYNAEVLLVIELGSIIPALNLIKKVIRKMPVGILLFETNKIEKIGYYFLGVFDFLSGKFGRINNK